METEKLVKRGIIALVEDLHELEHRAHGCGLHVTAQALNRAKNSAGWEIAGDIERAGKAARDNREAELNVANKSSRMSTAGPKNKKPDRFPGPAS